MKHVSGATRQFNSLRRVLRPKYRHTSEWRCLVVLGWVLFTSTAIHCQASRPSAYQVEAAYLYNFGKFVKWPAGYTANRGRDFSICVLDGDPFGSVLQSTLAGETLEGIPVVVKRVAMAQDAAACRVLFINAKEQRHLKEILTALDRQAVLTVSDISNFSKRGGMIEFVMEGDRVRFAINRTMAENAGLVLKSDLLKVAVAVRETGHYGGP